MNNYEVTKENTITAITNNLKKEVKDLIIKTFAEQYGSENVAFVRTGNTTKVNEIGVRVGIINENNETYEIVFTINPTLRNYKNKKTTKKEMKAFNFEQTKKDYENYVTEQEEKIKEKERLKKEKIERDKEMRRKLKEEANKKKED